jgi:hypothetical protein
VKRVRAKYLAIMRTKRRLANRLADIDYEYDVIRPGLTKLEKRITVLGELPEFTFEDDGDGDGTDDLA